MEAIPLKGLSQGWRALTPDGKIIYHLPGVDSLKITASGLVLSKEAKGWHVRRGIDGELLSGPVLNKLFECAYGTIVSTTESTWLAFPKEAPSQSIRVSRYQDAGFGWLFCQVDNGPSLLYYKDGRTPFLCPEKTDSCKAVSERNLVFYKQGKQGLISYSRGSLDVVLPPVYDSLVGPQPPYILAYSGGKTQLFTLEGKPIYNGAFLEAHWLNKHWLAGKTKLGWQAIHIPDLSIKTSLTIPKGIGSGMCLVAKGSAFTLLDTTGRIVGEEISTAVPQKGTHHAAVEKKGKWYLLMGMGEPSITLKINGIQKLLPFSENLAPFLTPQGLWGFIDKQGYIRISARYKGCSPFRGGLAGVCIGDHWGLIDKTEKFVLQPVCDSLIRSHTSFLCYSTSGVRILKDLNTSTSYLDIQKTESGYLVHETTGWGWVDIHGQSKIPSWYDSISAASPDCFLVSRNGEHALLSRENRLIIGWSRHEIYYNPVCNLYFELIP